MTVRAKTDLGVLQPFQPSVRNEHSFFPFSLSTLHHKTPWEYTILLASARLCLSPTGLRPPRPNLRRNHTSPGGGRDQPALKGDKEAAQDLAGFLAISPARLGPRPRSLDQGCAALSQGTSQQRAPSPRPQRAAQTHQTVLSCPPQRSANLAQITFPLLRLVVRSRNSAGYFPR